MELTFGQCQPSEQPPETAVLTDPDGTRPQPISARSRSALDAHALAIFAYRRVYGVYCDV
jgi:hypothetical protein